MATDLAKGDLTVAVFGAGAMGRGIAQVCAQAGLTTLLFDARADAVTEALAAIDKGLDGQRVSRLGNWGLVKHNGLKIDRRMPGKPIQCANLSFPY